MRRKSKVFFIREQQQISNSVEDIDSSQLYSSSELFPYLSESDRINLSKEVVTAINNELLHPEDLEVAVPRLLRSCANEAKELRRAINSIASSQLLEGHRAVQIIKESSERIKEIRELFIKQGELITGMEVTSGSYKQLKQLHFLRDNVISVIKWAEALKEVRYTNLYSLVEERQFAAVYKRLRRLQSIRRAVTEKSSTDYRNYRSAFDPYFEKLDIVQTMFVTEIYKLLEENSVYIAIQKALEDPPEEGNISEPFPEFTQLEECIQLCGEEIGENGNAVLSTSDGEWLITQDKVSKAVQKCVARLWEEQVMVDVVDPFTQISAYLEQMKKVGPLLAALEITLIPLSTKFSFFAIVVNAIHGEVMNVLNSYIDPSSEVEANGLLEASDFVQWYKDAMMEANYSSYIDLDSLDTISASMMTSAVGGLSTHLIRLCRACAIAIRKGDSEPNILPNGLPVTTGPMDMFTVLQQSLGGISMAIEVNVMRQIGSACAQAIEAYLEECMVRSDYDYWEEENETLAISVEEWSTRRLAFLYAFSNDCSTIERNMDTIELKFASYWEEEEGGKNTSPFQKVQDVIAENILYYVEEIVLHVERVVETQWALVFRSKEWYSTDNNPTQVIIDTMSDFIDEEFITALEESRVRMVTRGMMIRYIHKYLTTLMEFLGDVIRHPNSKGVEDWNTFIDCFSRDITISMKMWEPRVTEGRGQLVNTAQNALEVIKKLLGVKKPVDFNFIIQRDLLDDFGDCPSFVIRFILQARRGDVERAAREVMLSLWEEGVAHQRRGVDDVPTMAWPHPPSFLGGLERGLGELDQRGGVLRASGRGRRAREAARQAAAEKEKKRAARRARREADAAATKVKGPTLPKKTKGEVEVEVEVANLTDLFN